MSNKVKIDFEAEYQTIAKAVSLVKDLQKQLTGVNAHAGPYSKFTKISKQIGSQKALIEQTKEKINLARKASSAEVKNSDILARSWTAELQAKRWALKEEQMYGKSLAKNEKFARTQIKSINQMTAGWDKQIATLKKTKQIPFQGWAMSLMFFGMALSRVSQQLWTLGTTTFQEIAHSVEGATTGFDILRGSIAYLGFSIGQALEPLAQRLAPIVDWISEFVQKNESLVRWVIIGTAVFGAFFTILGMGTLAVVNGLIPAFILLKGFLTSGAMIGGIKAIGIGLKAAFFSPITWIVLLIAGLALVIVWIVKLKNAMGGWGEFFKSVLRGLIRMVVTLGEGLVWIVMKVWDGIKWILNGIIDGVNWIINKVNNLLGTNMGTIGNIKAGDNYMFGDAILSKYLDSEQGGWLAPEQGYATGGGMVPTFNIGTINIENPDSMQSMLDELTRMQTGG